MYQILYKFLKKFFKDHHLFKYGFNLSPMYRRSVGKVMEVSANLHYVKVAIPLNYKNRNYVGAIFGGSLYSATDPIFMIQLMQILGDSYVVWDKSSIIKYKRPARSTVYAEFEFSDQEINDIKQQVEDSNEIDIVKKLDLVTATGEICTQLEKTLYIATKAFYKKKLLSKQSKK